MSTSDDTELTLYREPPSLRTLAGQTATVAVYGVLVLALLLILRRNVRLLALFWNRLKIDARRRRKHGL